MSTYFLTSVRPLWDTLVLHMTGSSLLTEWWKVTNSQKYSFFAPPSLDRVSRNSRSAVTSKKRPGSRILRKSAAWLKSDTAGVYTSVSVTLTLMIACCVGDVLYLRWIYMFMNSIKKKSQLWGCFKREARCFRQMLRHMRGSTIREHDAQMKPSCASCSHFQVFDTHEFPVVLLLCSALGSVKSQNQKYVRQVVLNTWAQVINHLPVHGLALKPTIHDKIEQFQRSIVSVCCGGEL